jgi:hypothetical protein
MQRDRIPELSEGWRRFVEQVEQGYPLGLYDYRNDLDGRAILRREGAETEEIRALDERLKKMLTATDKRIWQSEVNDPFWDFGYPRNASGELLEELREEGLA